MMLMLHRGAAAIDYAGLRELGTPDPTASHVPIPHFRVVDLVKTAVGMYDHEVIAEHHGITEDGARYFGLLELKSPPAYHRHSASLRKRQGIGGVAAAAM